MDDQLNSVISDTKIGAGKKNLVTKFFSNLNKVQKIFLSITVGVGATAVVGGAVLVNNIDKLPETGNSQSSTAIQAGEGNDFPTIDTLDPSLINSTIETCQLTINGELSTIGCQSYDESNITGWYITSEGDSKIIYCQQNDDAPTECIYADVSGTPRQWCRAMQGNISQDVACDIKTLPNLYETAAGDSIDILCDNPGFPLATDCKYNAPINYCEVNHFGTINTVSCEAVGEIGHYLTAAGDTLSIYCTENNYPTAKNCLYTEIDGVARQWCRGTVSEWDIECDALDVEGKYEAATGDIQYMTCDNPGFPLAVNCHLDEIVPTNTSVPLATVQPNPTNTSVPTIASTCKFESDGAQHQSDCAYSNGSFTSNYNVFTGRVIKVTLQCSNIYAPLATGCTVTSTESQFCNVNSTEMECLSLGDGNYRLTNSQYWNYYEVASCTNPSYPLATGCTRIQVSECSVTVNGTSHIEPCAPIGDIGNYVTTTGDLLYIRCTENLAPMATGCVFTD